MNIKNSSMINKLLSFFKKSKKETQGKTPEGYCPNCWGSQEYDSEIRELYKDKQVDVNNHEAHYAFIQDFVVNHIDGIKLKRGNNSLECPTCRANFSK
jgi:hypothetical protein